MSDSSSQSERSSEPSDAADPTRTWRWLAARLAPSRTYAAWVAAVALCGVVLCFVPLFNLVGYESAAFFGVFAGVGTVFLTLHGFKRGLIAGPLSEAGDEPPGELEAFTRWALRHLAYLGVPLGILSLNAVRVKNCDFWSGLAFWALIPTVSVLIGQTIAWVAAAVAPERPWWQLGVAVAAMLVGAATFGLHLALQPPITGHQWFLGYFSGSIYDEALTVPSSLIAYRAINLLAVGVVLAGLVVEGRRRRGRPVAWPVGLGVALLVALGGLWWARQDLGVDIDRGYIQETALSGRLETEHFIIHYPENRRFLEQLDRLGEDHEFRYHQMEAFFGTDPAADRKIHSYVYPNRQVKGRMMGGRRTLVAKIWLGEMHVLWPRYGHHWLAHETAHLFTSSFSAGPLHLSMQNGIGINMGLVEGIATAADWPARHMSLHEASAALRRLEMAPDIRRIVGAGGFWTQSSGRAYTMMGSFIRYLIDEHGIEDFKEAYPHGNFRGAYGESVDTLVGRWERFVDGLELDEPTMEIARYRYRRPSIFGRTCARTTAEIRRRARIAASRGDANEATELYERLIGFAPRNVDYRIEFARQLMVAGKVEAAQKRVDELLGRDLPPVQRARLLQIEGDAQWHADRFEEAAKSYRSCLSTGLPWGLRRLVGAKEKSMAREATVRRLAFEYFLGRHPSEVALYFPMEWTRRAADDPLAAYLVGRRLWAARQWDGAVRYLQRAVGHLGSEAMELEARRMLGRARYALGDYQAAGRHFQALVAKDRSAYSVEAHEWLDRITWKRNIRPENSR